MIGKQSFIQPEPKATSKSAAETRRSGLMQTCRQHQATSTVDPAGWLREGAIVIVNTARGIVGENAAALIGSTLLNLATLAVAEGAPGAGFALAISILFDDS
jgi:hypothetical protein